MRSLHLGENGGMEILTAAQMAAVDRDSGERGVPVRVLMENAGAAVARFCERQYGELIESGLVVVLCGKGNNGGDGMVAARHLAASGARVRVVLLGEARELKDAPAAMWEAARGKNGLQLREIADESALREALC